MACSVGQQATADGRVCLVANLLLYVPARQTWFDMGLTDNEALDGNHGGQNDKSSINDGPGSPCIHNDCMIWLLTGAKITYQMREGPGKENQHDITL